MGGPLPNPIHHVLCNSFGFGGNDSCLILSDKGREDLNSELESDILDYRILSRVDITDEEHLGEIKQYVKPMEVRRMGKLMKSSLLSSLKALQQAGIEKPDAIITGTAWGCLENSELLLHHLTEEGEAMSSPTWFMQSTHNTISSNIAIRLKCHGYNVTYTQGSESLDWALRDALMLLKSGRYKTVLVGMHDETTPFYRQAMEQLGVKDLKPVHSVAMVLSVDNHE
jgi:3-oxoacyl-(acyl-carrier-protein) synthase